MRFLDDLTPVTRFLELKAIISEAEEELNELKPLLLEAVCHEDGEKYEHQGFEFGIQRRKVWEFDDDIKEQIDALKAEEKDLKKMQKDLQESAKQQAKARVSKVNPILVVKEVKR